jgi:hypothetical protein
MKSKAKSVNVFEIRLWSLKHYGLKSTKDRNIFNGQIEEMKTGKSVWFRSPAKMLTAIEDLYAEAEEKTIQRFNGQSSSGRHRRRVSV